jgi:hypothetical protein
VLKVFYLEFVMCHVAGMAKEDAVLSGLILKNYSCNKAGFASPASAFLHIYKIRNSFRTRTKMVYFRIDYYLAIL